MTIRVRLGGPSAFHEGRAETERWQGQPALHRTLATGFHPSGSKHLRGIHLCTRRGRELREGTQAVPVLESLLDQPVRRQCAPLHAGDLRLCTDRAGPLVTGWHQTGDFSSQDAVAVPDWSPGRNTEKPHNVENPTKYLMLDRKAGAENEKAGYLGSANISMLDILETLSKVL